MCQEISDLRKGELLALCRQPGVGAVICLLRGAASAEVSMENTPGEQSAGTAGKELREEALPHGRFQPARCMSTLRPPKPLGVQCKSPAPTEKLGSEKMAHSAQCLGLSPGRMLEPAQ